MTIKRLGKGLGAIIPEFPQGIDLTNRIAEIEVDKVQVNPNQPRKEFNPQAMEELKQSIRENGIIQPITVRQKEDEFELIAGERRLRACIELERKTIPAFVLSVASDVEMMEMALIENVQRENLNPVEEAKAYQILVNSFNLSHDDIAKKVGKERSTITNSLRLLTLPEEILRDLKDQKLSAGHARPIITISNREQQLNLWRKIKRDALSVRATEALVKKITTAPEKKQVPLKSTPKKLYKHIEDRLMHITGSRVRIKGKDRGVIEIEYYSKEDLGRLVEMFELIEDRNQ
ncbi:MAG TPA: ParB/RepB/Spo0J family partition protein [Candidatus Marinimicrobia bacterium]|nr:ParB/RepB/Spo0J family partition protein [Candidatus Neomarinimicrobiota bacterium]